MDSMRILLVTSVLTNCAFGQFAAKNTHNYGLDVNLGQYTTELINNLMPLNYNKNLRPDYGGIPLQVNVSILITDISGISEATMDYKVDLYIRHYWHDNRLSFAVQHAIDQVTLGEEFVKKIWLPDTYIENSKELNAHKTVALEETTLFRIKHNGDLLYSTRVAVTARCPMDLTLFPADQQKCSLEISSYGLLDTEMVYSWMNDSSAVDFHPEIFLPSFHLLGYTKFHKSQPYSTGNYSRLQVDFFLSRSIGYYISQVYVPTCLIVVISWVPFWLDRDDHHARVALGVTTVLTMTTLGMSTGSDSKISHLTAIDIYMFTAFIMVFLALLEYANVGYFELKSRKQNRNKPLPFDDAGIIDYWARRVFPITFMSFNLIYFCGLSLMVKIYGKHAQIQVNL